MCLYIQFYMCICLYIMCNAPYSDNNNFSSIKFNQFNGYAVTCMLYTTRAYYKASTKTVIIIIIIIIIGKMAKTLIYKLDWNVGFRLLWPCIMNVGWRERNQQDATNLMFIIKLFIPTCFGHHYAHHQENKSVHCRIWCSALVVMAVVVWSWDASCVQTTAITTGAEHHMRQCTLLFSWWWA